MKIWTYPFDYGYQKLSITVPANAKLLTIAKHDGRMCLIVAHDDTGPLIQRKFFKFGPAHKDFSIDEVRHIQTISIVMPEGSLLEHYFEELE